MPAAASSSIAIRNGAPGRFNSRPAPIANAKICVKSAGPNRLAMPATLALAPCSRPCSAAPTAAHQGHDRPAPADPTMPAAECRARTRRRFAPRRTRGIPATPKPNPSINAARSPIRLVTGPTTPPCTMIDATPTAGERQADGTLVPAVAVQHVEDADARQHGMSEIAEKIDDRQARTTRHASAAATSAPKRIGAPPAERRTARAAAAIPATPTAHSTRWPGSSPRRSRTAAAAKCCRQVRRAPARAQNRRRTPRPGDRTAPRADPAASRRRHRRRRSRCSPR